MVGHVVNCLLAFALGTSLALCLTPVMRDIGRRFGIVDQPDGKLKQREESVPCLGGPAIYLSFLLTLVLTVEIDGTVLAILVTSSMALVLGLIDDLIQLGPWTKLIGLVVAVLMLLQSGMVVNFAFAPWWISLPLIVLWLLAAANAVNLIDIMDGLAAGTAAVAALMLSVMAELAGSSVAALLLAGLAGACTGFLRYNLDSAQIYMGDSGSLFLGMTLGVMVLRSMHTDHHPLAALSPVLTLGVPLFELPFVMYVRWRRGLPVMRGSPDHVALTLRKCGLRKKPIVAVSCAATALLVAAALSMNVATPVVAAVIVIGIFVIELIIFVLLQHINLNSMRLQ